MYKAAGLYDISDKEAQIANTWTLASNHLSGNAIDFVPMKNGKQWWAAPTEVWKRMGEIGKACGFEWGGGGDITVDSALSTTSTNPVQNKVITSQVDFILETQNEVKVNKDDTTSGYLATKLVAPTGSGINLVTVTDSTTGEQELDISYNPVDYYMTSFEGFPECFVNSKSTRIANNQAATLSVYNCPSKFRFRTGSYIEVTTSDVYNYLTSSNPEIYAAIYKYVDNTFTQVAVTEVKSLVGIPFNTKIRLMFNATKCSDLEPGTQYYVALGATTRVGLFGYSGGSTNIQGAPIYPNFTFDFSKENFLNLKTWTASSYALLPLAQGIYYKVIY